MTINVSDSGRLADLYLDLKAQKADLAEYESELRAAILKTKEKTLEGKRGRVTVSRSMGAKSISMALAREYLTEALLDKICKVGKPTVSFNVRARVAEVENK